MARLYTGITIETSIAYLKNYVKLGMFLKLCKKTATFELMKVLFVGDASNMHNCLAHELRKMGHHAVVASNGSTWMNTAREINLLRHAGTMGTLRYLLNLATALPRMRGFDIVEVSSPIFLQLKPWRHKPIVSFLKQHNKRLILSALGTDYCYYSACHDGKTYRYSDYKVGNNPSPYVNSSEYIAQQQDNWKQPFMKQYNDYFMKQIDGAVSCLYEYHIAYAPVLGNRLAYAGIPIDTTGIEPHFIEKEPKKVKFFIGIQTDRNVIKGTDRLLAALKRVHDRFPQLCEMEVVSSVPYAEYVQRMRDSHVMLDQLYSYTPATNALIAMAQGMVAVSGAEPEYYDFIGEHDNHPIVNVLPTPDDDIDHKLEWIIKNKAMLPAMSRASRAFVEKHNAARVVAQRYLDFWNRMLEQ